MWLQAAIRLDEKSRYITPRIVQYRQAVRSIAIDVTSMDVIAYPKIFQHTRTALCSYRLKGSVAVAQSRSDQFSAKGLLLHDHPEIEQTVVIKVNHLELIRRRSADDWSLK